MKKTKKKQSARMRAIMVFSKKTRLSGVSRRKKKSIVPNAIQSGQAMSGPKVFPRF